MQTLLEVDFIIETLMNHSHTTQTLKDHSFALETLMNRLFISDPNELGFDHSNPPHGKYAGPVQPELHMDVFRNLSSTNAKIRAAATLTLVQEMQEVQMVYEQSGIEGNDDGYLKLEATKDACLKNCAPTMKYAIRRLICGISSSRALSFLSSKMNLVPTICFLLSKLILIPKASICIG